MNAPELLRQQQLVLAKYIRSPAVNPPPANIEDRRLAIYREIFYASLEGLLAGNFPVIKKILGDAVWNELVREFYRDYSCQTPYFPELPREFIHYLELRAGGNKQDPAWLLELAHYEWIELALDLAENEMPKENIPVLQANTHDSAFSLSPLAWPLAYQWPVHRLSPDYLPKVAPDNPTFLLVYRDAQFKIHFDEITALVFRLLQLISDKPKLTVRQQLTALAREANVDDLPAFMELVLDLIRDLIAKSILRPMPGNT